MEKKGRRTWLRNIFLTSILSATGIMFRQSHAEKTVAVNQKKQLKNSTLDVTIAVDAQEARQILDSGFVGFIWVREFCTYEFNHLNKQANGRVNGLLIDGHLDKQISIASKIKPKPTSILVVTNGTKKGAVKAESISSKLENMGFNSFVVSTDNPPYILASINQRLGEAQAIMMTPMQSVFTRQTMRIWLLMSIRQRTPMIGAWRDYQIQSGALAGYVYGDDEVDRIQELALKELEINSHWPESGYKPRVTFNKNTGISKYYSIEIEG